MSETENVLVIGGGVMGLASTAAIAKTGIKVTLLDASTPETIRSSRGDSRGLQFGCKLVIVPQLVSTILSSGFTLRLSPHAFCAPACRLRLCALVPPDEGVYADLVKESAQMWHELEAQDDKKRPLVAPCGNLAFGTPSDIEDLLACHRRNDHEVTLMSGEEIQRRWPTAHIQASAGHPQAVYDGDGHGIDVTLALEIFAQIANENGATIQRGPGVEVTSINRTNKVVNTKRGESLPFTQLVLTCGPWTNKMLAMASLPKLPLFVSNEQLIYLRIPDGQNSAAYASGKTDESSCPIVGSFRTVEGRPAFCFMVPHFAGVTGKSMPINDTHCVKVAVHQQGELMDTDDFVLKPGTTETLKDMVASAFHRRSRTDIAVTQDKTAVDWWQQKVCADFVSEHLPGLDIDDVEITYRCLYTNTVDNHFVVGDMPSDSNVIVATGAHCCMQ
jgi:glycine/D-amino acid oxidase-like deaminating enzyme